MRPWSLWSGLQVDGPDAGNVRRRLSPEGVLDRYPTSSCGPSCSATDRPGRPLGGALTESDPAECEPTRDHHHADRAEDSHQQSDDEQHAVRVDPPTLVRTARVPATVNGCTRKIPAEKEPIQAT